MKKYDLPPVQPQNKRVIFEHKKSKFGTAVSAFQITGLALELSRKADNTIDLDRFSENCQIAFDTLTSVQSKLDQLQNDSCQPDDQPS